MASLTSYVLISEPGVKDSPNNNLKMYDKLEQDWSKIRFDAVDVLHIAPFNAWHKGTKYIFGMGQNCTEQNPTGDFTDRFEWIVKRARFMNPKIKIIAMQMHNDGDYSVLKDHIDSYTTSVANFMRIWLNKTSPSPVAGKDPIKMHVDGYDVDYEWGGNDRREGSGNYQKYAPNILSEIRTKIDNVSTSHKFYVSISAANTTGLANTKVAESLDYVKMQNYDGGIKNPQKYLEDLKEGGIKAEKLVYGISTEWPPNNDSNIAVSVANVVKVVNDNGYAGLMTWRLNSDNLIYQSAVQVWLYNHFNSPALITDHSDSEVLAAWNSKTDKGGRKLSGGRWATASPWML